MRGHGTAYEAFPDEWTAVRDGLWCCCITRDSDGAPIDVDARVDQWPLPNPEPLVVEFAARAREPLRAAVQRTAARL